MNTDPLDASRDHRVDQSISAAEDRAQALKSQAEAYAAQITNLPNERALIRNAWLDGFQAGVNEREAVLKQAKDALKAELNTPGSRAAVAAIESLPVVTDAADLPADFGNDEISRKMADNRTAQQRIADLEAELKVCQIALEQIINLSAKDSYTIEEGVARNALRACRAQKWRTIV